MSMRRFFRAHRDEDYSQIQYLTAKCTRLAHDKALLDREFLVSRDRERKLQNDLEAATTRLFQQEQQNMELRMNQDQLISRIRQQQDLVDVLQQRLVLLAEESRRDAELLRQVSSELLCLQSSEVQLEGLVEELHAEAQHRAAVVEDLQAELHTEAHRRAALTESLHAELRSKTAELEELQDINKTQMKELKHLRRAHQEETHSLIGLCFNQSIKQQTIQVYNYLSSETSAPGQENGAADRSVSEKLNENIYLEAVKYCESRGSRMGKWTDAVLLFLFEVRELQRENEGSLRKLQETAEQFEWLCQQQRYWMCCVKRFKDCLLEEREIFLQQVSMLEKKAEKLKKSSHESSPTQSLVCPLQDTESCVSITSWDADAVTDLESQVENSSTLYEELFDQAGSPINGHQKPP